MFERFTERARQVVALAQEEARTLKHDYIGTEHILLGLLREKEGLAARILESLDITVERVRAQVVRIVGSGDEDTSGALAFTSLTKKVFELALREALSLGHNYIGTEHILLGVCRESKGVAARILLDLGANSEKIRNEVISMLAQQPSAGAEEHAGQAQRAHASTVKAPVSDATLPDLSSLTDQALKDLIGRLTDREQAVSYERRILHGNLDILRAELVNRLRRRHERGEKPGQ